MDDNLLNILQKQNEVATRTEQKVDDLHNRLFGNGQPGTIQNIEKSIKEHEDKDDKIQNALLQKVSGLEISRKLDRRWLAGVCAVISLEGVVIGFYFQYIYNSLRVILVK
jgi:uncharacterized protein Yka (UPF0111/DUF47 family)